MLMPEEAMVQRIYVEKLPVYAREAEGTLRELTERVGIRGIESVRLLHRYDVEGLEETEFRQACEIILSEAPVDRLLTGLPAAGADERILAVEALPGQFDQRADSASQAIQLLTHGAPPTVRAARVWIFGGTLSDADFSAARAHLINPVESREASLRLPLTLELDAPEPGDIPPVAGFINLDEKGLEELRAGYGLAMSMDDLRICRAWFAETERRDPTETELRVLDTYWSDHCRHTTFLTRIESVEFGDDPISKRIEESWRAYLGIKKRHSPGRAVSLMDLATLAMKQFRAEGRLQDLDASEEINACSIRVNADIDGRSEPWLLMFKNETHNHPTEIEPFGGAATCLGGAIRDPLSGRSYVYQAMRVTGSADPREPLEATLPGKLPQRTISTVAARGYSSYGNQIGIATGQVHEFYHPGYKAKHMEIGAVVGAVPESSVRRREPAPGDLVLLIGGRTGRDGIGGATGSSKEHSLDSLAGCGAEVQKGNPPTERKLQRLFRNPDFAVRILRCNDFGAGGIAVAVGELAPGLEIDLDAVPRKYEGLNGTELAISESQERMALVIAPEDLEFFIRSAADENLEATLIARVSAEPRLVMRWRNTRIVDLSRAFLETNGAEQTTRARIDGALEPVEPFAIQLNSGPGDIRGAFLENLGRLEAAGQEGLGQLFDSSVGAASLLVPFGGASQATPADGMAALLPVPSGECRTASLMSFGFDPRISSWSPYHGALYAVLQSAARITALGGDYRRIRLSLQEYFERLGTNPVRWGKPLAALLGAFAAQQGLEIPAIGGKDSMSGTFEELDVPPTLAAFAVAPVEAERVRGQELKSPGSVLWLLQVPRDAEGLPDLAAACRAYRRLYELPEGERPASVKAVGAGGVAGTLCEMAFGNSIGIDLDPALDRDALFSLEYGSLVLELPHGVSAQEHFDGLPGLSLGQTTDSGLIRGTGWTLPLTEALAAWRAPLDEVFPRTGPGAEILPEAPRPPREHPSWKKRQKGAHCPRPRVLIPVFPGTNCEYDSAAAFERAGAQTRSLVLRNLTPAMVEESIRAAASALRKSQILLIPGGFSAGDEPEGSGKFIAAFFRNPELQNAVEDFLDRDGLILGICNGFQALLKLGLLPQGHIAPLRGDSPTLTFNTIGAHISRFVTTRIEACASPWLARTAPGELHRIPVSHGEGRFVAAEEVLRRLEESGQIAARYSGCNPNGSTGAIEALVSPDGRILGKMGHSERVRPGLYRNIPGEKDQKLFEAGVDYFR
jgi:phosphoribosylformylglycinamidine synthase